MNAKQISLVQNSFKQVVPIAQPASVLFYAHLFELDPSLRGLFNMTDIIEQGRKLMATLGMAVSYLTSLEQLLPTVQLLGLKHVDYGVKATDYDTVGQALLWMLAQVLEEDFTLEVETAWTATYFTLAGAMKAAAYQTVRAPMIAAIGG